MIPFQEIASKEPGAGARLEDMATKASASLPGCIKLINDLNIREDTKNEVKKLLDVMPNVEVRLLDGIALPVLFSRKVNILY